MKELIVQHETEVEKFWLDPKNILSPIKNENVLQIHVSPRGINEFDAILKKIRKFAINLETLSIDPSKLNKPWNFEWILNFCLKKLTIKGDSLIFLDFDIPYLFDILKKMNGLKIIQFSNCMMNKGVIDKFLMEVPPTRLLLILEDCHFFFHISSLLDILNSLGEMKNKKILKMKYIHAFLDNDLDEEMTIEIFEKAQKMIDEKFNELKCTSIRETRYCFYRFEAKGKLFKKDY